MEVILEIRVGARSGEEIVIPSDQAVTVGRTQSSTVAIPHDTFLSRVHFALERDPSGVRLIDRKSANGTFVNGVRVSEAVLHDGDIILAGQTEFTAHITQTATEQAPQPVQPLPETPPPKPDVFVPSAIPSATSGESQDLIDQLSTAKIGGWFFGSIPEGWELIKGFGLRRFERNTFPSEVMVAEEALPPDQDFNQHVESQLDLLRMFLSQPQISPADPPPISGTEETKAFTLRYKLEDGRRFVRRQVYVRSGGIAGSLAMTTLESELPLVQTLFAQILQSIVFTVAPAT